jgi:type IV secretion system protein VirB8
MNALPKTMAAPVDPDRLREYFQDVQSFQSKQTRSAKFWGRVGWSIAGLSLLINAALAGTVLILVPLKQLVPVYISLHKDGTFTSTSTMSDLPPTQKAAALRAAIWQYVRDRESYDYADAGYRYDVVSLMSSPTVRAQYHHKFLLGDNPNTVQKTVGQRGQINVHMINMSFVRSHVALVRYHRVLTMYGSQPVTTTWTATVEFTRVHKLPLHDRLADPGGIIVTNYQDSKDSP